MKKPILAVLGLAGACAVCCAIPIAMGVAGVVSIAGLTTFAWGGPTVQIVAAGLVVLTLAGFSIWWSRHRTVACQIDSDSDACDSSAASGCGCPPPASKGAGA